MNAFTPLQQPTIELLAHFFADAAPSRCPVHRHWVRELAGYAPDPQLPGSAAFLAGVEFARELLSDQPRLGASARKVAGRAPFARARKLTAKAATTEEKVE